MTPKTTSVDFTEAEIEYLKGLNDDNVEFLTGDSPIMKAAKSVQKKIAQAYQEGFLP